MAKPASQDNRKIDRVVRNIVFGFIAFAVLVMIFGDSDNDQNSSGADPAEAMAPVATPEPVIDPEVAALRAAEEAARKSAEEAEEAAREAAHEAEEAARKAAEEAEEKRYGQHCLSPWDGSQTEFVRRVKNRLNDPKSFDHVETRTWPVDPEGRNRLLMTFRAKNAFGGLVLSKAIGTFDNETCSASIEAIE